MAQEEEVRRTGISVKSQYKREEIYPSAGSWGFRLLLMLSHCTGDKLFSLKPNSYLTTYYILKTQSSNPPVTRSRVTAILVPETNNAKKDVVGRIENRLVNNTDS